jgi:hypothetical protein
VAHVNRRFEFNQALGLALRHVIQTAVAEESARCHAASVRETQEGMHPSFRDHTAADNAVLSAGAKTDAAIMEVTDQIYDLMYPDVELVLEPEVEPQTEALRLGATG